MVVVYLVNVLLVLYSIFHLVRTNRFIKDKRMVEDYQDNDTKIIILIPCFKEQKIIKKTIEHVKKIVPKDSPIIIVTTEKEEKVNDNLTTKEYVLENIVCEEDNIYLIHYPKKTGYMADQLNYAIEEINKNYEMVTDKTYICVYNADSYPNRKTFDDVFNKINKDNYPKVIQQYSYCFKNIDSLNSVLKGFAVYQSNFELKIGLLNAYFNNKLHKHVVGHGLFIRLDLINEMNGFNTKYWCEDIYLSSYLQNKNIPIVPLLTLENMETPNTLSNLMRQNSVWFNTSIKYLSIFKDIKKDTKILSVNGKIALINEIRSAINWLCFPFVILVSILISILNKSLYFSIITILSYLFYIFCYYISTINIINNLDKKNYKFDLKIYFGTVMATFISNLGPLHSIIIRPKEKHKTER